FGRRARRARRVRVHADRAGVRVDESGVGSHYVRMNVIRRAMPAIAAIGLVLCAAGRADAAGCTISTTSVSFGSYNVFTPTPTDSIGSFLYRCNGGAKNI